MVFHSILSDSQSPQVSRTLLSILAISTMLFGWFLFAFLFPSPPVPRKNPLLTVPSEPITNGITAPFMFQFFFQFSIKVKVFISLFAFRHFYTVVSRTGKVRYSAGSFSIFFFWLFFCFCLLSLGLVV